MPYQIIKGNITKISVDAIVNSLEVHGEIRGKLCQSILKASKSEELENFLKSKVKNTVGSIYVTKAWNLPSKNIIHVVAPRRFEDDDDLTLLKKTYSDIIENAIQLGYKSIALPFIGTGENGYTESEAYSAVTSICSQFADIEEIKKENILDIIIVTYIKKKRKKDLDFLIEIDYVNKCCSKMYVEMVTEDDVEDTNSIFHFANLMSQMTLNEYFEPDEMYYIQKPWDFIEIYMEKNKIDEKVFRGLFTKQRKSQFKEKVFFEKKYIYLFAYILNFSPTVLLEFMVINGCSFSPIDMLDIFIKEYYFDECYLEYEINNLYDFQQLIYDVTGRDDVDFSRNK